MTCTEVLFNTLIYNKEVDRRCTPCASRNNSDNMIPAGTMDNQVSDIKKESLPADSVTNVKDDNKDGKEKETVKGTLKE